jgi:hypothetical protein
MVMPHSRSTAFECSVGIERRRHFIALLKLTFRRLRPGRKLLSYNKTLQLLDLLLKILEV